MTNKVYVTDLFIDKVSVTAAVAEKYEGLVKKKMEGLITNDYAKKAYKGYMYRTQIDVPVDGWNTKYMLMQCHPTGGKKAFFRVEFNPSSANMLMVKAYIDYIFPGGYKAFLQAGRITRLDWAIDIVGLNLRRLCIWCSKTRKVHTYGDRGKLETLNLGGEHSAVRYNCYDKRAQVKKMLGDDIGPCTRIEINTKPFVKLMEVVGVANPFESLHVCRFSEIDFPAPVRKLIWMASMSVGPQAVVNSFSGPDKAKLVSKIKVAQPLWWRPKEIWKGRYAALDIIRKPKGKKDFSFGFKGKVVNY